MTICHCKTGVMSQCKAADSFEDQMVCMGFARATRKDKCMFLNESMNNHCWSPDAQIAANTADEIDVVDAEIEEMSLGDLIEEEEEEVKDRPRQFCGNCIHLPCAAIKAEERRTGQRHLSDNELWNLGSGCDNYDPDTLIAVTP